eukprot:TRINITY_DN72700_c0_g1_i1.p1 TRINITY_DN72700_c0_g1~~TRINITY_DN72700_c0_g1_i1.p1  ORF type:complete len:231 (+),score=32.91 TRINITY_DN72700_c0_g1_i1:80-694(+)
MGPLRCNAVPCANTYAAPLRLPNREMCLLYWYGVECPVGILSWWWAYSRRRALLGDAIVNSILAFNLIGSVMFYVVGAAFIFWSYRFQHLMVPSSRRYRCVIGIACSFLPRDLPLVFLEIWITWRYGWFDALQGLSVLFTSVSFCCGFFACWLTYAWRVARCCENRFGGVGGGRPREGRRAFRGASSAASSMRVASSLEEPFLA